jgi:hypothetical protein
VSGLWFAGIGMQVLVVLLVVGFSGVASVDNRPTALLLALWPVLFFVLSGLLLWRGWRTRLRCYERGLAQPAGRGEARLPYDSVEQMTWNSFKLLFRPSGANFAPILCRGTFKEDEDLLAVRDHVARLIAHRMGVRLNGGDPVPWTDALRFLPGGLEYRPRGLLGPGEPVNVPYAVVTYTFAPGVLVLQAGHPPRPVHHEPLGVANLYPGLTLLGWIQDALRQQWEAHAPHATAGQRAEDIVLQGLTRTPDAAIRTAPTATTSDL